MDIIREKTACFTGHRPEKLPGGSSDSPEARVIKSVLYSRISEAVNDGYDTFITGMQRGVDLWAGEIVLSLAADLPLKIIAALPYRDIGSSFRGADKWAFGRIMSAASETVVISESYTRACMQQRNRFMVDNSSRLIAVIGNEKSGTGQTLRYAVNQGIDVCRIDLNALFPDKDQMTLL